MFPTTVTAPGRVASSTPGTQVQRQSGGTSKSDFLRLLTEQLRHQDPLNPLEDKEMMAQLAQFSALEETQGMRQSLDLLASSQQMAQGASFLGKKVTGALPPSYDVYGNLVPGVDVSGVVEGVTFQNGQVLLRVGTREIPLVYVNKVETG